MHQYSISNAPVFYQQCTSILSAMHQYSISNAPVFYQLCNCILSAMYLYSIGYVPVFYQLCTCILSTMYLYSISYVPVFYQLQIWLLLSSGYHHLEQRNILYLKKQCKENYNLYFVNTISDHHNHLYHWLYLINSLYHLHPWLDIALSIPCILD